MTPSDNPQEVPLNDYAKRVAPLLVAAFPEHSDEIAADDDGDLRLELECPSDSVFAGLSIETYAALEYVIVSFDTSHADYSDWHGEGTDDHIHEAMQAAHDILNERLVAVAWYSRRGMAAGTLAPLENSLAMLQRSQQAALRRSQTPMARIRRRLGLPHQGQLPKRLGDNLDQGRVTLRSWNASHDADTSTDVLSADGPP